MLLFSDSQSAVGILTLGWENKSHKAVVAESRQYIDIFRSKGVDVDICWNPGHADISGNEIVDKLAKAAAEEAEEM